MFYKSVVLALAMLTCGAHAHVRPRLPSHEDVEELRQISAQIQQKYQNENVIFLFMGRSLEVLRAQMEVEGLTNTYPLPLSKPDEAAQMMLHNNKASGELSLRASSHLQRFLPIDLVGARKYVLLDFCVLGNSLLYGKWWVHWYLQQLSLDVPVETVAIIWREDQLIESKGFTHIIQIRRESTFAQGLIRQIFKKYSEYASFPLADGVSTSELVPRVEYQILKEHLVEQSQCKRLLHQNVKNSYIPAAQLQESGLWASPVCQLFSCKTK